MQELRELAIRCFWTFLKTFLSMVGTNGFGITDLSNAQMAMVAALGPVLTIIQVYAAQKADSSGALSKALGGATTGNTIGA